MTTVFLKAFCQKHILQLNSLECKNNKNPNNSVINMITNKRYYLYKAKIIT